MNIYVIADTHFFHDNIIDYCKRPFKDSTQMNKTLITNWNSTVQKEDLVIVLGDIAFSRSAPQLAEILKSLNGTKVLVRGNHDKRSRHWYLTNGFVFVCDSFTFNDIIFTHKPVSLDILVKFTLNIHGHIHEKTMKDRRYVNVGAEQVKYTPILLQKVIDNATKIVNEVVITPQTSECPPNFICIHCGMDTRQRNPSGYCDHLYYPETCQICQDILKQRIK